jgi:antitoxin component of RelBE/YafQ-DinJ toxin-antitoxin module
MKSLLIKIGVGVSVALNLFVFTVAMYGLITREERVEENRKWLKETIEKEVYDQIKFVMPKKSGDVMR